MNSFSQCLHHMVSAGLLALQDAQAAGKLPANPVSEAHFINAWITTALKQKHFDRRLVPILQQWQQSARSRGQHADIKGQFEQLADLYARVFDGELQPKAVTQAQITALYETLANADWQLALESSITGKCRHHSDGRPSLVVCRQASRAALSVTGELQRPLSLYVRGDHQYLIDAATAQGLLLFKRSDYKSLVKYHGEYQLFPDNDGPHLPALPTAR